jgi:DNA-binding IclR family transcriptional regulator
MEQGATSYHSQGLARALIILRALSEGSQPLTLAQLAESLGLPKSTLVRLLMVLEAEQFVYREGNPPTYTIGHAVLEIAETFRNNASVSDVATAYLRDLARETGLTANIGVLEGRWVLHVCVEEPDRPLRFRSSNGSLDDPYCTGLGKMLLSALPTERIGNHLPVDEPYNAFTKGTLTTKSELLDELRVIRERGYSIDAQERDQGVMCLAVPIPNESNLNVALSVAGPTGEVQGDALERYRALLTRVAAELGSDRRFLASLRAAHGSITLEKP